MYSMVVTLEVSKLSGRLNADAACRESQGRHTVQEEVQSTWWPEVACDRGACSVQERARLLIGSRARGGAHGEHLVHVCDAGCVEAQRPVEHRRALPRVRRRAYGAGRGAEYREAGGGGRPRCTQRAGQGSSADWEQGTGRAHVDHVAHVRDTRRVEAQRLVERPRLLPSRTEGIRCGARVRATADGVTASSVQRRLDCRLGTEQAWSAHRTS